MFTDTPSLPLLADLRHRDLLAEAERYRLVRDARAARRAEREARRHPPAAPPDAPPAPVREPARERRWLVPR